MSDFDKFLKFLLPSGAPHPESPIIACPYYIPYFPHWPARKCKNLGNICIFSRIFSITFKFFLILMHILERLTKMLGFCPIVNFVSDPRKSEPTFGGPCSTEKSCMHYWLWHNRVASTSIKRFLFNCKYCMRQAGAEALLEKIRILMGLLLQQ